MTLDDAYANAAYIPQAEDYPPRWAAQAAAFRDAQGARGQIGVRYGPSDRQVFDFFQPTGVSRGTMMFVHGGYWKAFDASSFSHLAAGALARGWAVALPSYDLCPDVRISEISTQIAAALTESDAGSDCVGGTFGWRAFGCPYDRPVVGCGRGARPY